jgi:hypothetical protein
LIFEIPIFLKTAAESSAAVGDGIMAPCLSSAAELPTMRFAAMRFPFQAD